MNRSASTIASPISVAPSISKSITASEPSGKTGAAVKVATPATLIMPDTSNVAASNSPLIVKFLIPV